MTGKTQPVCSWRSASGIAVIALLAVLAVLAGLDPAYAQVIYPPEYAASCTYNPQFDIPYPSEGSGIITMLVSSISRILNNVAFLMYHQILGSESFQLAVRAALTIFVMVYAILFTFGMTQTTILDFLIRLVKFAIVATLISPNSWTFFYNVVGKFFNEGTDFLIAVFSQIAVGTVPGINPSYPFAVLDNAIANVTSSKLFVTLIATFFTGPYGLIIGGLIVMGLGTFVAALFQAMWVYLMSLVIKAFLFALAPIFFAFLLFGRTRHLFDGWLNALVSASLQPIFLFAFFAFFAKLIEAALYNLLRVPVCWTPPGVTWQGTPFDLWMWRFMVAVPVGVAGPVGPGGPGMYRWEMYGGAWSFTGAEIPGTPVFPLSLMDVLIFLLLVQLAWRFNGIVINIAKDIAGASLQLNLPGALSEWARTGGNRMQGFEKAANFAAGKMKEAGKMDPAKLAAGAAQDAAAAAGRANDPRRRAEFLTKLTEIRRNP